MAEGGAKDVASLIPCRRLNDHFKVAWATGKFRRPYEDGIYQHFLETGISEKTIADIEELTRGQHANPNWAKLRGGLATSSNFHYVVKELSDIPWEMSDQDYQTTNCVNVLLEFLKGDKPGPSDAIKWGTEHEKDAFEQYRSRMHGMFPAFNLRQTGLVIYKENPLIGCSPDGIASCRGANGQKAEWAIEIKCRYQSRYEEPEVAAKKAGLRGNPLKLPRKHPWNYQIQGVMGILGLPKCDLVVHTLKGIHITSVPFDQNFFDEMMFPILKFIRKIFYHAVLDLE